MPLHEHNTAACSEIPHATEPIQTSTIVRENHYHSQFIIHLVALPHSITSGLWDRTKPRKPWAQLHHIRPRHTKGIFEPTATRSVTTFVTRSQPQPMTLFQVLKGLRTRRHVGNLKKWRATSEVFYSWLPRAGECAVFLKSDAVHFTAVSLLMYYLLLYLQIPKSPWAVVAGTSLKRLTSRHKGLFLLYYVEELVIFSNWPPKRVMEMGMYAEGRFLTTAYYFGIKGMYWGGFLLPSSGSWLGSVNQHTTRQ